MSTIKMFQDTIGIIMIQNEQKHQAEVKGVGTLISPNLVLTSAANGVDLTNKVKQPNLYFATKDAEENVKYHTVDCVLVPGAFFSQF